MPPLLSTTLVPLLSVVGLLFVVKVYAKSAKNRRRYPPGPFAYPLIGNLLSFPLSYPWKHFPQDKENSDLVYYHGLGNSVLILNSMKAINDLLVRKGNVYSSRPRLTVACEMIDLDKSTAMVPYGDRWKLHRKLSRTGMNPEKVKQYEDTLSLISNKLVNSLHQDPKAFAQHVRLATGRVLLSIIYGIETEEEQYVALAKAAQATVIKVLMPLAFAVDLIPALKYLPKWIPFLSSHEAGLEGRKLVAEAVGKPFARVREDMASGHAKPSFALDILTDDSFAQQRKEDPDFDSSVMWASATMFVGGQELTAANIMKMIASMATNPDKLKRAQCELRKVIGDRTPTVQDRDDCPYVHAIVKETMRFNNSAPLGLLRSSVEDDIYEGHFIPKGTIVIPNTWAIAHELTAEYPPDIFAPERFLRDDPSLDPSTYHFGFGRRICPGKALAENAMFLLTANILNSFDIKPRIDENGEEIPIRLEFTSGLLSLPSSFQCDFIPLSQTLI